MTVSEGQGSPSGADEAVGRVLDDEPTPPFDGFYQREWRPIVAFGWSLVGTREAAEELAQDAFLDAFRRWDEIGRYDRPGAWLRRAVANRATSLRRRQGTEHAGLGRLGRERPSDARGTDDDAFWAAVRTLPERQAACVALHYLEDRPVRAITEVLECSPSTVKVHLHRGRRTIAERLGLDPSSDQET